MIAKAFNSNNYRYGFNGKETDKETGTQDYGMRIYNAGLARFLSVDPLTDQYPFYSPYQFAGDNPILNIDLDGLEPFPTATNLEKTKSVLNNAMSSFWGGFNNNLLRAANASVNSRPTLWWQHAHGYANNGGNRTFNKLKGVAGEAIAANVAKKNFAKYANTMVIVGDVFQATNDPEGDFEGFPGGTWDYGLTVKQRAVNSTADNESPIFQMTLYQANGYLGQEAQWNLSSNRTFLFEIKTLNPQATTSSLYLNIVKGFNQAINNATYNKNAVSILMVDDQAYKNMYEKLNESQKQNIASLHSKLAEKGGGLWLVNSLEQRAKDLANEAYKEIKEETTNESTTK